MERVTSNRYYQSEGKRIGKKRMQDRNRLDRVPDLTRKGADLPLVD